MEWKQRKPAKMSVPQFGGWEHKDPGVPTDYSMVFSQARANKKNQKIDLTDVKRLSTGYERPTTANQRQARAHVHSHAHAHAHAHVQEDPHVMWRRKILNYMSCCRP